MISIYLKSIYVIIFTGRPTLYSIILCVYIARGGGLDRDCSNPVTLPFLTSKLPLGVPPPLIAPPSRDVDARTD